MFNFNNNKAAAAAPVTNDINTAQAFPGVLTQDFVVQCPSFRDPDAMRDAADRIPTRHPEYAFQPKALDVVLDYLADPCGDALYIYGPSGSGKTSLVCQAAARLGWPLVEMTLNSRFEVADLIGHNSIIKGEVVFQYGPLVEAMQKGYILLLNEVDLADPGELAGLNDIVEGRPLTIIQNGGEVVAPNPMFRLIVTANTAGSGATVGNFAGTGILNSAFLDRFRFLSVGYMPEDKEKELIKAQYGLDEDIAGKMVRVANEVRRSHLSQGESSVFMTVPLTTRVLTRWAHLVGKRYKNPEEALDTAFGERLGGDEKVYLHRLFKDVFGDTSKAAENTSEATA